MLASPVRRRTLIHIDTSWLGPILEPLKSFITITSEAEGGFFLPQISACAVRWTSSRVFFALLGMILFTTLGRFVVDAVVASALARVRAFGVDTSVDKKMGFCLFVFVLFVAFVLGSISNKYSNSTIKLVTLPDHHMDSLPCTRRRRRIGTNPRQIRIRIHSGMIRLCWRTIRRCKDPVGKIWLLDKTSLFIDHWHFVSWTTIIKKWLNLVLKTCFGDKGV